MYGLRCWRILADASLILAAALLVLGCGDLDREFGAGGTDKSGSLLNVDQVDPIYFDESTRQVDVVQNNCETDPTEPPDPEPFTDHYADVTLTNRPLPNREAQTASTVHLVRYEVRYTPVTEGAPYLASLDVRPLTESVAIPPCQPGSTGCSGVTFTADFVRVLQKGFLAQYLADYAADHPDIAHPQFTYNVHYVFYGENDFGEEVSADGFSFFYAADYNNCSGGGE